MNILITGASTGIGRATAIHLARKGHHVWAGVRSDNAATELLKLNVERITPVRLDVTNAESVESTLAVINKAGGVLHGLVNNAGIAIAGPIEAVSIADWQKQFDVNVIGQVRVIQKFLPMLRTWQGRVVNISSIAGKVASPFMSPYAASKFAFEGLSDSLRRELAPMGVHVSVVEPGPIDTPIWKKSLSTGQKDFEAFSAEIQSVYGSAIQKFYKRVDKARTGAAPTSLVVEAIEHALTASKPKTRYPVGRGIRAATLVARALPDRWVDYLGSI